MRRKWSSPSSWLALCPDARRHRPLDEAFRGGVVAVEQGQARRVEHELGVDLTAAVEPPRDEPHPIVTTACPDRFDGVGQLSSQAAGSERRQLLEEHLGEERVGQRHG